MSTVTVIQPIIEEKIVMIRCAAYCRVSSDSEDQLNSFMAQTRYYSQIFENSETEILVDIYADEGVTGTREDKRDEFQRMMKDCRKGKIDRIYTKSISRFARNTRDCLKNVRELKSLGITIYFEKENLDTANMTDEMMITILGGLHNYKSVLVPLYTALQDLKIRRFNGNSNVMDIHKEIAKLKEQTHVLARLKTKGFLNNAKYLEQTTELTAKINKLQSELKRLTRSDDEDETLEQIEMLIDFFENPKEPITEFEESAFENIVEKIVVINQNELGFHLIGGLKFTEKIL